MDVEKGELIEEKEIPQPDTEEFVRIADILGDDTPLECPCDECWMKN